MATINVKMQDGSTQPMSYPDDWTQDQVKSAIYKHFPPVNSQPEQPEPRTGLAGIGEDVIEGARNAYPALKQMLSALPGQAYGAGKQAVTDPVRAILNLGGGLRQGMEGMINTPANIAEYLSARDIGRGGIEDLIRKVRIPESDLEQRLMPDQQEGDTLLRGIGSFAPYARIGGAARGLAGLAKRAGGAGAYAVGQNENPVTAALMGLAGEGAIKGAQKLMRPGTFLPSSPLSDVDLREAVRQAAGTETSLGNLIENPYLKKRFENELSEIPFSGANQAMQRTAKTVTERGNTLLETLKGNFQGNDIGSSLHKALKSAENDTRQMKDKKFRALNEAAEKEGVTTNRTNLRKTAQDELDKVNADPDLSLLVDSSTKKLLENISTDTGKGQYSLKQTDFLRGKLGDKAHDAFMNDNTDLGKVYRSLREAADNDINDSITNSGKKNLDSLRDEAFKFYEEHYVPFEEPEIMKFTRKGGDTDLMTNAFIKTSKASDRSNLLSKISSKLSKEDRNLLAYSYFSRALKEGQFNPQTLKTLYKNLGDRQKEALLSKDMIKNLSEYSKLVEKNTKPLNLMFNPETGQKASFMLTNLPTILSTAGALATGSIPLTAMAAATPSLLARPATKLLTSETLRNQIVDRMIKARARNVMKPESRNLAPFIQALIEAQNGENTQQ